MQYRAARSKDSDPFETGDLTREYGLVAGRVVQFAEALECGSSDVLDAAERTGSPLVDTGQQNPETKSEQDRPTDPEKRSLTLSEQHFRQVAAVVGAQEALKGEPVPSEIG
jgi:hypothetical protein